MPKQEAAPVQAAIDIGSNTIHIVVARCQVDDLDIVADEVEIVRIGESVTATGEISAEKRDAAIAVLRKYKELAERHNAERVIVVATEAIRKARNSSEFLDTVRRETGLQVLVISGDAEATLTFYGATYEKIKEQGAPAQLAVMDLGGGSTELVTAKNGHISWRTSIPVGSGWLHDRYLCSNPPSSDDISVAQAFLQTYFQGMRIKEPPTSLIVTGGSANSLLLLAQKAFNLDAASRQLTYEDLLRCEGLMGALPAEEIAQRYQQPVARARILPAGALIIREMMARLHLNDITVSPHGIREGVLLALQRYGEHWLDNIDGRVTTAMPKGGPGMKKQMQQEQEQEETFAQTGQRLLEERVKKLLEWRTEVLKNEDIEAVHKMRVASRRLRAALDAFETCCKPGQFKKIYQRVKEMADLLGTARDTDVMLLGLQEKAGQVDSEERAGVEWLIKRLRVYRQQKQEQLEEFFATFDENDFKQQVVTCIKEGALSNGES
ncbi:MAG: CHAD domain-containing protein [Ktedonobacteraceae bacterium]